MKGKKTFDSSSPKHGFCSVASILGAICIRGDCLSSCISSADNPCGLWNNLLGVDGFDKGHLSQSVKINCRGQVRGGELGSRDQRRLSDGMQLQGRA